MFRRFLSLIAVVFASVLVAVFVNFPTLTVGETPAPKTVSVQPKQPTLGCPGPVFVNGGQNGVTLGSFTQTGSVNISGEDSGNAISTMTSGEKVLSGTATGSKFFNAIQAQLANLNQAAGLAVANCTPGSNEAWLVAGDNSVGREALLVLANSTAVDATVSLQLYGTSGPIQGSGLSGISAPAKKVTVLPLSSFAPKAETFALHVSSRGAELGIWLQQKTVRGLTPAGLDLVGASAEPSKKVMIPGMFLRDTGALATLASGTPDFADLKPILRVTAPGDKAANFTAQIQGADGSSFGTVVQGNVPAGSTRDFALEDLADGNYAVYIESDEEILASARFSRMNGTKPDFAWAQSVTPTKLDAGFTTDSSSTTRLSVVNGSDQEATISLNGRNHKVEANSNLVIQLSRGSRYAVTSTLELSISQVIDRQGGIAVTPVLDYQSVGGQLKVLIR